jgi:hypothetical protein
VNIGNFLVRPIMVDSYQEEAENVSRILKINNMAVGFKISHEIVEAGKKILKG